MAQQYYEQDREFETNAGNVDLPQDEAQPVVARSESRQTPVCEPLPRSEFLLNDEDPTGAMRRTSPKILSAQGFGLSRDKLQEAGLSVTGRTLSRYQRLRKLPPPLIFRGNTCGEESGCETSDCDDGGEVDALLSSSGPIHRQSSDGVRKSPKGAVADLATEARAYGTREVYRSWRLRAMVGDKPL